MSQEVELFQTYNVSSGQTDTGDTVDYGGTLNVLSGGTISNTQDGGGSSYGYPATVNVASGGTAIGTVVNTSGQEYVEGGATAIGTVMSGGVLNVLGTISNTQGNGIVNVSSGGTAIGTTNGGTLLVLSGGTISNTLGGSVIVSGGTAIGTVVNQEYVYGGTTTGTVVNGQEQVYGGTTIGTVVNSNGVESVAGGTAITTIINSGGYEFVENGGTASGTVVYGAQFVYGGTVIGTVVKSGGQEIIKNLGTTNGTVVKSGGSQYVYDYATANGTVVNGVQYIYDYATASGTVVNSGGIEYVYDYATAHNTVLNSGGTLFANGGTVDIAAAIKGGSILIDDGTVDMQQASADNVTFQLGGTGGLELDVASAYTGKVSGFGNGGNTSQSIDLTNIVFNSNVHRSYSGSTTSGVLTVTSGTTTVAKIAMVDNYTTASFKLGADSSGHVQITDPPSSTANTASGSNGTSFIDKAWTFGGMVAGFGPHDHTGLSGIGFGARTTLAHLDDGGDGGGTLPEMDGTHSAKLALLGHYMATSFVTAADGHGGTLFTEAAQAANQLVSLTTPHAG